MFRQSRSLTKYDLTVTEEEFQARVAEVLHLEQTALEDSTRQAIASHERCYTIFCRSMGVQAFPVSFMSLGLFLTQYCRWFGNTARSIPTILAHLKRVNRSYSTEWLDQESVWRLQDLITSLRKRDPVPSRQKLPITHQVMNDIQAVADLTNYREFQHVVMSRVARDALLRGMELVALRVGEISPNDDFTAATIIIHYSKAHKRVSEPETVIITDYGPSSGVAFLREYFRVMRLGDKPPAYPLWPLITDMGDIQWTKATPKYKFIQQARFLLAKAGYPHLRYAGHSYRSGGATDLWESNKCRALTIKLHGRWRSDAYRLYIRDNPHKTAEEVAQALAFFDQATQH